MILLTQTINMFSVNSLLQSNILFVTAKSIMSTDSCTAGMEWGRKQIIAGKVGMKQKF